MEKTRIAPGVPRVYRFDADGGVPGREWPEAPAGELQREDI